MNDKKDKKWSQNFNKNIEEDNQNNEPSSEPKTVVEEIQRLNSELDKTQKDLDKTKDQLLRSVAEMDNIKKRAQKDIEDANNFAVTSFAKDMISILENIYRTTESLTDEIKANNADAATFFTGVEMTQKELESIFNRHGIKRINPLGEKFDYNYHQAISQIEDAEKDDNTIIQVMQSGYTLKTRLLRPAMVVISKKPVA